MLDAFIRGKVRSNFCGAAKNYHGQRELSEDLITSTVFGMLKFMPADAMWHIVRSLFLPSDQAFPLGGCKCRSVEFWPLGFKDRLGRVEPDIVFSFEFEDTTSVCVVVEVKWNAPVSQAQLRRQRNALDSACDNSVKVYQAFLGKDAWSVGKAKRTDPLGAKLVDRWCTWSEVAFGSEMDYPSILPSESKMAVEGWRVSVSSFLSRLGVVPFSGFSSLPKTCAYEKLELWHVLHLDFRFQLSVTLYPLEWMICNKS